MSFLRCVSGRVLTCGCLVGVYERYNGAVVATIDARGAACTMRDHTLHAELATVPEAYPSNDSHSTGAPPNRT